MLGGNSSFEERQRLQRNQLTDLDDDFAIEEQGRSDLAGGQPTINLAVYWGLALKHRFVIIGCFFATLMIGATLTLLTTPIYTARATLQIDREAARVVDVGDVAPRESITMGEEFFQTQFGLIRSRSLSERVIESLGLASSNDALEAMGVGVPAAGGTATEQATLRRAAVLATLQANLSVAPIRGSRLVAVSYNNPNPEVAARIANGFSENFIQANLDRKFESSSYAREFLEERIAQTKERLESAERQLVAYASNQQIINVGEPRDGATSGGSTDSLTSNSLIAANNALADTRAERVAAEERWKSASTSDLMTLPEVLANPTVQRLAEQRALLDAEYQQKLSLYQPEYPEMLRLKARIDETDVQLRTIAGDIRSSIRSQYEIAANQERSLQAEVTGLTSDVLDLRNRSIQYNILQRELDTTRTLYEGLLQRYKEVGVTGGLTANNISVVDFATPPREPSKPSILLNMALAAFMGLGLGVLGALVLEALDETLATPDDVEKKLGIPLIGLIPLLDNEETPLAGLSNIRSAFSEAYYSLRTALQFATQDGAPSSLLVSSAGAAEGKSTTAYAVALNLARVGKRVLLVDGDLRNPSLHRTLGVENDRGMSNLLSGSADLEAAVLRTRQENLFFIPCGPLPPNPAELWGGDRLRQFLAEARNSFDHVVIDGPPVLGFADAPILAAAVNGTLFVLESRGTRRGQARGALRRLQVGRARLLGAVLTKFSAKSTSYSYGYGYGYDYTYDYSYAAKPAATPDPKPEGGKKGKRG